MAMKPLEKQRRKAPVINRDKEGNLISLQCPFCREPHDIAAGKEATCGTKLELTAVQSVFHGSRIVCARCGEEGGTLRKAGPNSYIHTHECTDQKIYAEIPKTSLAAALSWKLPDWTLKLIARIFKRTPERLTTLDDQGDVVGYRWRKI